MRTTLAVRNAATQASSSSAVIKSRYEFIQQLNRCKTAPQLVDVLTKKKPIPAAMTDAMAFAAACKLATSRAIGSLAAVEAVTTAAAHVQGDFPPPALAECIESFAKQQQQQQPAKVPAVLINRLLTTGFVGSSPAHLSTVAWSLAKTGQLSTTTSGGVGESLLDALVQRRSLHDFSANDLTRVAWAYSSSLNSSSEPLQDKIAKECMSRGLACFTPQQLAGLVASCPISTSLLARVGRETTSAESNFLRSCSNRNLAELLRAFAIAASSSTTLFSPAELVRKFAGELMVRADLHKMTAGDFTMLITSLAQLVSGGGGGDHQSFGFVFQRLLVSGGGGSSVMSLTAKHVGEICTALFALRVRPPVEWVALACDKCAEEVEDEEVVDLIVLCCAKWWGGGGGRGLGISPKLLERIVKTKEDFSLTRLWALACLDLFTDARVRDAVVRAAATGHNATTSHSEVMQMQQIQLAWEQAGNAGHIVRLPPTPLDDDDDDNEVDLELRAARQHIAELLRELIEEKDNNIKVDIEALALPGVQVDVLVQQQPQQKVAIEFDLEENRFGEDEDDSANGFVRFQQRLLERGGIAVRYLPPAGFAQLDREDQLDLLRPLVK